jgi:hypothetical protein
MLIPLYGFVRGDTLGLLVLIHDDDTISAVAQSLAQAASVRVAPFANPVVYRAGKALDPTLTVAEAGLTALERIDLAEGGSA